MIKEKSLYEEMFQRYASNYDMNDKKILLKVNHMYRVRSVAREIATRLNLPKNDIELAEFLGLYHDIGRFEQLKQYDTFDDSKSFDHGDFGADILEKNGYINWLIPGYNDDTYEILLCAVRYHNKFRLDDSLKYGTHYLCKIIRDADKIDIYRAMAEESSSDLFFDFKDESDCVISDEVKDAFYQNQTIDKSKVKTKLDRLVLKLAFAYDINYNISKDYLLHLGNVDMFVRTLLNSEGIRKSSLTGEILTMFEHITEFLSQN